MGYSLEEIAEGSTGRLWFQLYLWKSEEVVNSVISPAYAAGCEALVATVDVPVVGKRERDLRTGMSIPARLRASNAANAALRLPWLWRMLNGPEITFGSLVDAALVTRPAPSGSTPTVSSPTPPSPGTICP